MTKPDAYHPTSEELFAYRDGELPNERRTHVEAHVLVCAHCKERVDEMSALESDLRMRPDDVGDEYYERMTESVLARARQPVPADEAEEAAAPAVAGRSRRGARRESEPPPFDRRRPDVISDEISSRRRFRLPWIGIAGSGAAAAAVMIVAVILFQRQQEWLNAPRPAAVTQREAGAPGAPAGDAKRSKKNTESSKATTSGKASGEKATTGSATGGKTQAGAVGATTARESAPLSVAETRSNEEGGRASEPPAALSAPAGDRNLQSDTQPFEERTRDAASPSTDRLEKDEQEGGEQKREALQRSDGNDSAIASGVRQQASPEAAANKTQDIGDPKLRLAGAVAPPGAPGEPYAQVLREHSLPVVWNQSVSRDALLKAEPDLRRVYQTRKAGADSARIRLYLAEAERAKMGNPPDSARMDAAVNHYRRAISLAMARGDTAVADVARRRLAQLFGVTPPAPSTR